MADGYARVARAAGHLHGAIGRAANLASGLQDALLGRTPVIALTGHKEPSFQQSATPTRRSRTRHCSRR